MIQVPYAIIIGCSDSRVIPERIFHAAIHHDPEDYIKFITDEIKRAIGEEKDEGLCILSGGWVFIEERKKNDIFDKCDDCRGRDPAWHHTLKMPWPDE